MSIETMLLAIYTGLVCGAIPTTSQDSMSYSKKKSLLKNFLEFVIRVFWILGLIADFFMVKTLDQELCFGSRQVCPLWCFTTYLWYQKFPKNRAMRGLPVILNVIQNWIRKKSCQNLTTQNSYHKYQDCQLIKSYTNMYLHNNFIMIGSYDFCVW